MPPPLPQAFTDSDDTATKPCLALKASYPPPPHSGTILPSQGTEESRGGGSRPHRSCPLGPCTPCTC